MTAYFQISMYFRHSGRLPVSFDAVYRWWPALFFFFLRKSKFKILKILHGANQLVMKVTFCQQNFTVSFYETKLLRINTKEVLGLSSFILKDGAV
jgi:hypothetical protein